MNVPAAAAALIAACAVVVLQGCGSCEAPAPAPTQLVEFTCSGSCVVHAECWSQGEMDRVFYLPHDCASVAPQAAPSGSCADYAAAREAMDSNAQQCQRSTVCCAASNNADVGNCAIAGGSMCSGSKVEMV